MNNIFFLLLILSASVYTNETDKRQDPQFNECINAAIEKVDQCFKLITEDWSKNSVACKQQLLKDENICKTSSK